MSYETIDRLTYDINFQARVRSCTVEQADTFRADERQLFKAVAEDVLRGGGSSTLCFVRLAGAAPGLADKAAIDDTGEVDQSRVTDDDILASVQSHWQIVGELLFADT